MPNVRKQKPQVRTPETPQEASDLARSYLGTAKLRAEANDQYDAERKALIAYLTENKMLDDPQGIVFESADGTMGLVYRLSPRTAYQVSLLDNDTILWAAEHNVLTASKAALDPHKNLPQYEKFKRVEGPVAGVESLDFVEIN